jgi:hypothetical protein
VKEEEPVIANADADAVISLLCRGLRADGAHHKQWFLERALAVCVGLPTDAPAQRIADEFGEESWEPGVAP